MGPDEIRDRLVPLRPLDFAAAERLAQDIRRDAGDLLPAFVSVLIGGPDAGARNAETVLGMLEELSILPRLGEVPQLTLTTNRSAQITFRDPVSDLVVTINGFFNTTQTGVRIDWADGAPFEELLLERDELERLAVRVAMTHPPFRVLRQSTPCRVPPFRQFVAAISFPAEKARVPLARSHSREGEAGLPWGAPAPS